jgi:hypothetical protein
MSTSAVEVLVGPVSNPANGHEYFLLQRSSWAEPQQTALEMGGHLAVIGSEAENAWITATFGKHGGVARHIWIGLAQVGDVFRWVDGEPTTYANWAAGEPNNAGGAFGNEDWAELLGADGLQTVGTQGQWNDLPNNPGYAVHGLVEVEPVPGIIGGPFTNPANGHIYYLLAASSWEKAERKASELGGHLVTVNDQAENSWVMATFGSSGGEPRNIWIGLSDAQREGVFTWASGEPLAYTNWRPGQPDNAGGAEHYAHIWAGTDGLWNDLANQGVYVVHGLVEIEPPPRTDCTAAPAGLVGWWPGEGNAKDLSGGNNGILVNATTRSGFIGEAFAFGAQGSYVQIPTSPAFEKITNAITLEAWVWHEATSAGEQRYVTLTPDRARIQQINGHFAFALVVLPLSTVVVVKSDISVEPRRWYHVAATYDGSTQRLYADGARVAFSIVDAPLPPGAAHEVFISSLAGSSMNGLIDEVAIYNRALTAAEIQSHFTAGRAGMCKAPVFAGIETLFPGVARLSIKGQAGKDLDIFGSTDLVNWVLLTRVSNPKGAVRVDDAAAGPFRHRFYRAVMP